MTLTKQSIVDKIEVVGPYSHLQVRVCERVQAIAGAIHTPELISAYQASLTTTEGSAE